MMHVFFTIDENYLQHFAVAVTSLLENNRHMALSIYIIHDISDPKALQKLLEFIQTKYKVSIQLIAIDGALFDQYKITGHISRATYFRLLLADILPSNLSSGLFLDADLVVTGSLSELEQQLKGDFYLKAVSDTESDQDIPRINQMGIPIKRYFNAGVMLINLKAWRASGVTEGLLDIASQYNHQLKWWDQDVLNIFFHDKFEDLDQKFNGMHLKKKVQPLPLIIHFTSPSKPWHFLNLHPYKNQYWKYLKLTPFKKQSYTDITPFAVIVKLYQHIRHVWRSLNSTN